MEMLDGRLVSQSVREDLRKKVDARIIEGKKIPHLAAILIGTNGASETYVASKVKSCEEIGFKSTLLRLPADIPEETLLEHIAILNEDTDVDGKLTVELLALFLYLINQGGTNQPWANNGNADGGVREVESRVDCSESSFAVLLVNEDCDVVL